MSLLASPQTNAFLRNVNADAIKMAQKLIKLKHDLKVEQEQVAVNTAKDSYEVYLETTLNNAEAKLEKELDFLREQYEQKVRKAQEAFDKTKLYCQTQLQNAQEKKFNTPRIRKLTAEIKVLESEYEAKKTSLAGIADLPPLKNETVSPSMPEPVPSAPQPQPADSVPKKKRVIKVAPGQSVPTPPSLPSTQESYSMKDFATGLQNGDWKFISIIRSTPDNEMRSKYGFTWVEINKLQEQLFG